MSSYFSQAMADRLLSKPGSFNSGTSTNTFTFPTTNSTAPASSTVEAGTKTNPLGLAIGLGASALTAANNKWNTSKNNSIYSKTIYGDTSSDPLSRLFNDYTGGYKKPVMDAINKNSFNSSALSLDQLNSDINDYQWVSPINKSSKDFGFTIADNLSASAQGASHGATFGPWGALIGGIIGGGANLLSNIGRKSRRDWVNNQISNMNQSNALAMETTKSNINKNNYADIMRNTVLGAEGGQLFADGGFTNGIIKIENGGTHEDNPLNGVPFGMGQNGQPNLVEEGEIIFNGYVYSKRLKVPEDLKKSFKFTGETFADAAYNAQKESEERPNDPISKNGLNAQMQILMAAQEEVRMRKEAIMNKIKEQGFQVNPLGEGMPMDSGMPTQEAMDMQEAMPPQMPQGEVPMMAAYGGNLFAENGSLEDPVPGLTEHERRYREGQTDRSWLTSRFGRRNINGTQQNHPGIDIQPESAYRGAADVPVQSIASGTVYAAGSDSHNGNYVFIEHADGTVSKYLHMRYAPNVHVGDQVTEGQAIGVIGNSGTHTNQNDKLAGFHLDFRYQQNRNIHGRNMQGSYNPESINFDTIEEDIQRRATEHPELKGSWSREAVQTTVSNYERNMDPNWNRNTNLATTETEDEYRARTSGNSVSLTQTTTDHEGLYRYESSDGNVYYSEKDLGDSIELDKKRFDYLKSSGTIGRYKYESESYKKKLAEIEAKREKENPYNEEATNTLLSNMSSFEGDPFAGIEGNTNYSTPEDNLLSDKPNTKKLIESREKSKTRKAKREKDKNLYDTIKELEGVLTDSELQKIKKDLKKQNILIDAELNAEETKAIAEQEYAWQSFMNTKGLDDKTVTPETIENLNQFAIEESNNEEDKDELTAFNENLAKILNEQYNKKESGDNMFYLGNSSGVFKYTPDNSHISTNQGVRNQIVPITDSDLSLIEGLGSSSQKPSDQSTPTSDPTEKLQETITPEEAAILANDSANGANDDDVVAVKGGKKITRKERREKLLEERNKKNNESQPTEVANTTPSQPTQAAQPIQTPSSSEDNTIVGTNPTAPIQAEPTTATSTPSTNENQNPGEVPSSADVSNEGTNAGTDTGNDTIAGAPQFDLGYLRYAPIVGGIRNVLSDLASQPDYSYPEQIENTARQQTAWNPIGGKMDYKPMDLMQLLNNFNANASSLRNNVVNSSNGNSASAIANLYAVDSKSNAELGKLLASVDEINQTRKKEAYDHNYQIDAANSEGSFAAQKDNRDRYLTGMTAGAEFRDKIDRERAIQQSANYNNLLQSIAGLGEEYDATNTLRKLYENGVLSVGANNVALKDFNTTRTGSNAEGGYVSASRGNTMIKKKKRGFTY